MNTTNLVAFTQFFRLIENRIPGNAPEMAMENAIRDGAIRVYRETNLLQEYLPAVVNLVAGQSVYEITSPSPELTICDIPRMTCAGGAVYLRSQAWLDEHRSNWEQATSATPDAWMVSSWTDQRLQFIVNPIPNASTTPTNLTGLTIRVELCPTTITHHLDGSAYNQMREAIRAAALKDLFEQKGMPYYDEQMAAKWDAVLLQQLQDLRVRAEQGADKGYLMVQVGKLGDWPTLP